MKRTKALAALMLALCVGLAAAPARASLLLAMDLAALTARADHVVVGQVRAITSEWTADHRRIYSRIELDVVETWRSTEVRSMERVTIWQVGGERDDLTMIVPGMPTFTVGDRAVLFLKGAPERARVVGGALGKLPLVPQAAGLEPMVRPPRVDGVRVVGPGGTGPVLVPARPTPLSLFRAQVDAAAARRAP